MDRKTRMRRHEHNTRQCHEDSIDTPFPVTAAKEGGAIIMPSDDIGLDSVRGSEKCNPNPDPWEIASDS